ncbi:hypothetical protein [Pseudofrankia sp. BMG5.36]|uniref:hypothetical protein n=1 Tax=Pseudofrankia sp. BMG5.36 TaxID=1834512 RepID=UPI0008DA8C19|nr:hypothetical protein [Pseudofrankia sp. BMG5.36]OHV49324.1 hypothetical protein BCD48_12765 [Pseudofrankia sp. BMG5.36]
MGRSRPGRLQVTWTRRGTRTYSAPAGSELPPGATRDIDGQACTRCGSPGPLYVAGRRMVCMPGTGCRQ